MVSATSVKSMFILFIISLQFLFGGQLEKGFDALKVFDYFKAKEIFSKSIKNHPAGASYGLSEIFYRSDNPFHNIDSAYKYVLLADKILKYLLQMKKKIC